LQQLRALPNSRSAGLTGNLQLNAQQRIERLLYWAQFNNGQLESLKETQID
jgi:outer membrane PBP1 activator LpoA protein